MNPDVEKAKGMNAAGMLSANPTVANYQIELNSGACFFPKEKSHISPEQHSRGSVYYDNASYSVEGYVTGIILSIFLIIFGIISTGFGKIGIFCGLVGLPCSVIPLLIELNSKKNNEFFIFSKKFGRQT